VAKRKSALKQTGSGCVVARALDIGHWDLIGIWDLVIAISPTNHRFERRSNNMPQRLAATLALLAFAVCLVIGALQAGNTFITTVCRALAAMVGTYVIGLTVGWMGQKMIEENVNGKKEKLSDLETKPVARDR
jgi:predicted PurR-regulated permease PerM